jgi:plastocyanin
MHRLIVFALLAAAPATAEKLTGTIEDPTLRRKVDVVYLAHVDGTFPPPKEQTVVNQRGNTYRPHLTVAVVGTKVLLKSEDKELHNVFARHESKAVLFNDAILPGGHAERTLGRTGLVHLTCNVHKEMSAYVLVVQNPFFAVADHSGSFTIDGVPPGTYTLRIWGEELSDEDNARTFQVTVGGAGAPLRIATR